MTVTTTTLLSVSSSSSLGASTTSVQDLIDAARIRHWSFADIALGDGAALLFLNQRQRTHLAQHGAQIEGIVGTSVQVPIATVAGLLVTTDAGGVPTYTTTYEDGWPLHITADVPPVPWFDTTEPMIATDPFGAQGGTPGFPLPSDMVRLINVALVYNPGAAAIVIPCDVITERERFTWSPGRNPAAFVSGNRLVPVLPLATGNANDRWFNVQAIQLSYVGIQTLAALTDLVMLPSVLCEALTADLAMLFAMQSEKCPPADKQLFIREAQVSAEAIAGASLNLIDSVQQTTVLYRG